MIRLLHAYIGRLTNENVLYPKDYEETELSPELVKLLLEKGYAQRIEDTPPVAEASTSEVEPVEDVTTASTIAQSIASANKPKSKK
jgi:hypothetical protein